MYNLSLANQDDETRIKAQSIQTGTLGAIETIYSKITKEIREYQKQQEAD